MESPLSHLRIHRPADTVLAIHLVSAEVLFDRPLIVEVGKELYDLANQFGEQHIILGFQDVRYIASEMLGKLVTFRRMILQKGGQIVLCNLDPVVLEVFVASHLDTLFPIVPDEADALKLIQSASPPPPR